MKTQFDIFLYFWKLEDKYWGFYLLALFLLFVFYQEKEQKGFLRLAISGLVAYLHFVCPLTYLGLTKLFGDVSVYYQIADMMLTIPVLAFVLAALHKQCSIMGKKQIIYLWVFVGLCFLFVGRFAYLPPAQVTGNAAVAQKESGQVYDMVLTHAKERGDNDGIYLWGPTPLMIKSRMYDGSFKPIYGKDIATFPERYSETQLSFWRSYSAYEADDTLLINMDDQIWGLANFPLFYPEIPVEYMVMYDPQYQGADVKLAEIYENLGYEYVGRTDSLLVYYLGQRKE